MPTPLRRHSDVAFFCATVFSVQDKLHRKMLFENRERRSDPMARTREPLV